jgi:hypothetical protein
MDSDDCTQILFQAVYAWIGRRMRLTQAACWQENLQPRDSSRLLSKSAAGVIVAKDKTKILCNVDG